MTRLMELTSLVCSEGARAGLPSRKAGILLTLGIACFCYGCTAEGGNPGLRSQEASVIEVKAESFSTLFDLERILHLYQTPDTPIVMVSGSDFSSTGEFLLGDASESNVKRFDFRSGSLLATFGRYGQGPGEYYQPAYPRFDDHGRIHVADRQLKHVTVLDESGNVARRVPLREISNVRGFAVTPYGYVVSGRRMGGNQCVIHVLDSLGTVRESFLPLQTEPTSTGDYTSFFRNISGTALAVRGDTAFLTHTLHDTLWTVNLSTGEEQAAHFQIPDLVKPFPPEKRLADVRELEEWRRGFHLAVRLVTSEELIAVSFVRGVLNYGDPQLLVVRLPNGRWVSFDDAPPLVNVYADQVITLRDPLADEVELSVYRLRRGVLQ